MPTAVIPGFFEPDDSSEEDFIPWDWDRLSPPDEELGGEDD